MTIRYVFLFCLALVLACPERNRVTGPTGGNGVGPEITITDPPQDVIMQAGSAIFIRGVALDEEGVDSIYYDDLTRLVSQPAGGIPRAEFAVPVDLFGAAGDTITVIIYAANVHQVRGDQVTRRIRLR
jgi:hypothetical protein